MYHEFPTHDLHLADMTPYMHERAKSLQMIGRYQEAILDFTRVLRMHSKNAHAYFR